MIWSYLEIVLILELLYHHSPDSLFGPLTEPCYHHYSSADLSQVAATSVHEAAASAGPAVTLKKMEL